MNCPNCGAAVESEQQYCDSCGRPLQKETVGKIAEKHLSYDIKSAISGMELLVYNLPALLVLFIGVRLVPYQWMQTIGQKPLMIVALVVLIGYNIWLYRRSKDEVSLGLFS